METLTASALPANVPLSDQHIVLIPGFLGFSQLGDFSYFAATVGSTLANALAQLYPDRRFLVHAFETLPADSLRARQGTLQAQLKVIWRQHPNAQLHLVGHSTGGLDAELLLRTPRPGEVRDAETDAIRRAIRSVTTIGSPLAGTSLALSPLARLFAIDSAMDFLRAPLDLLLFRGPSAVLAGLGGLFGLVVRDSTLEELIYGLLHSGGPGASYFLSLLLTRALIDDLAPETVREIMAQTTEDPALPAVHRARFVTIARREQKPSTAGLLFRTFYDSTEREARPDPEAVIAQQRLRALPNVRTIGVPPTPTIDLGANDGIVDTARQLLPSSEATIDRELGRIAALVIADHIDIIGYFPGMDGKANGFLSSGSNFRQPEFDLLYAAVADKIAATIAAVDPLANAQVPAS